MRKRKIPRSIFAGAEVVHPNCRATSAAGVPCKLKAMPGGFVCRFHGGRTPRTRELAEDRLREMVHPMINRLRDLAMQTDDLNVAAKCVKDALDRAGIGALVQAKVRASMQASETGRVTVNIGFLTPALAPADPQPIALIPDAVVVDETTH